MQVPGDPAPLVFLCRDQRAEQPADLFLFVCQFARSLVNALLE